MQSACLICVIRPPEVSLTLADFLILSDLSELDHFVRTEIKILGIAYVVKNNEVWNHLDAV